MNKQELKARFIAKVSSLASRFENEDEIIEEAILKFDEESSTSSNEIYKSKEE